MLTQSGILLKVTSPFIHYKNILYYKAVIYVVSKYIKHLCRFYNIQNKKDNPTQICKNAIPVLKKITQSRLVSNTTRYIIQCKFLMKINVILTTKKKSIVCIDGISVQCLVDIELMSNCIWSIKHGHLRHGKNYVISEGRVVFKIAKVG